MASNAGHHKLFVLAPGITGNAEDEVLVSRGMLEILLQGVDSERMSEAVNTLWAALWDQPEDAGEYIEFELDDGGL